MRWLFLAGGFLLIASSSARSATIIDNGVPDQRNGSEMTHWLEADDFTLTDAARLESVTFWDFELTGFFSGSILWQIFSDNAGAPGDLLYSGVSTTVNHVATGYAPFGSFKEFTNTFNIVPVSLPKGTYWIALHNGQLSGNVSENFFWEASTQAFGYASHSKIAPFSGNWDSNAFPSLPSDLAFRLDGVPAAHITGLSTDRERTAVAFTTTAGSTYRLEYKDNLVDPSWIPVSGATFVVGSGDVVVVNDSNSNLATRAHRFYRVALTYHLDSPLTASLSISGAKTRISFPTAVGYYYRVEFKDEVSNPVWTPVAGAETISGTGSVIQITDLNSGQAPPARRFYRVSLF
jgi:hypothetical protein